MAYVNGVYHPTMDSGYQPTGSTPGSGDLGQMAATAGQAIEQNVAAIQETRDRVDVADDRSDLYAITARLDSDPARRFAWSDRDGNVSMWVNEYGDLVVERELLVSDDAIPMTALKSDVRIVPSTYTDETWTLAVADEGGNVAGGFDSAGRFVPLRGAGAATALRTQVACIGDSLTRGADGGDTWPLEDSWPMLMEGYNPGITVANLGISGWTTDEIRIRWGIVPIYLTVNGGTIPTSGSVGVSIGRALGMTPAARNFPGHLAGVGGTLRWSGSVWEFIRAGTGTTVPVTGKVRFVPNLPDDYSSHTVVLWLGRNDVTNGLTGRFDNVADHVVSGVLETVEWLAPRCKAVVVCGTTQTVNEINTHPRYPTVIEINERLAQLLPTKYLDIRTYLVHQAIYDAGLTPTQADLDAMEADGPPPQIWDNGSHFLQVVAPYVATHIGNALTERGLI